LNLPATQQALIKEIQKIGKPTVLVLLNGSALAINWEDKNIPAIVEAWYPGQAGGQAIADILFGDYNPAGRLPVTFYKNIDDLPPFEQYDMTNQTYRYYKGEALYPFGYGLSYSNFTYSNIQIPKNAPIGEEVPISVDITNTSKIDGEEVVQVYVTRLDTNLPVPLKSLKTFKRLPIAAGETTTVSFRLPADTFLIINEKKSDSSRKL
jgi:beta-glucosidase